MPLIYTYLYVTISNIVFASGEDITEGGAQCSVPKQWHFSRSS